MPLTELPWWSIKVPRLSLAKAAAAACHASLYLAIDRTTAALWPTLSLHRPAGDRQFQGTSGVGDFAMVDP